MPPKISPARTTCYQLLCDIESRRFYSDDALNSERMLGLEIRDRHLTTEIVYGTLRWQALLDYVSTLAERAEKVRARMVQPYEDNMLCITGDGRKAALDLSLVIPTPPNSAMPKIDVLADVAADIYEATSTVKGTQIIFCDLATPKGK